MDKSTFFTLQYLGNFATDDAHINNKNLHILTKTNLEVSNHGTE
jgi:hypothetical protein